MTRVDSPVPLIHHDPHSLQVTCMISCPLGKWERNFYSPGAGSGELNSTLFKLWFLYIIQNAGRTLNTEKVNFWAIFTSQLFFSLDIFTNNLSWLRTNKHMETAWSILQDSLAGSLVTTTNGQIFSELSLSSLITIVEMSSWRKRAHSFSITHYISFVVVPRLSSPSKRLSLNQ